MRNQISVINVRALSEVDFSLLLKLEPATVSVMMRQRVQLKNHGSMGISNWLEENAKGLYFQRTKSEVWFENEEDLVLFVAAYQGKIRGSG